MGKIFDEIFFLLIFAFALTSFYRFYGSIRRIQNFWKIMLTNCCSNWKSWFVFGFEQFTRSKLWMLSSIEILDRFVCSFFFFDFLRKIDLLNVQKEIENNFNLTGSGHICLVVRFCFFFIANNVSIFLSFFLHSLKFQTDTFLAHFGMASGY